MSEPDFQAQFRDQAQLVAYMGGYAASCGNHPSLPKRHRWGAWEQHKTRIGVIYWDRTCRLCALVSDARYQDKRP